MTKQYKEQLEIGNQYQDYVTEALARDGIRISIYTSQAAQLSGENMAGIEVKYDGRFRETGNLYIEYAEKSNPFNEFFVPSGICREDNTWLYLIGDYDGAYALSKRNLRRLLISYQRGNSKLNEIRTVEIGTSRGLLLPVNMLGKYWMDVNQYDWTPYKEELLKRLNINEQQR